MQMDMSMRFLRGARLTGKEASGNGLCLVESG